MKQLLTILILMSKMTFVFSQLPSGLPNDISKTKSDLPDKIKIVRQYQNDYLLNVREYDTLKNEIFSHYKQYVFENWNGKYLTMIIGNIYDASDKIIKSYELHSNAGHSILYYEYDSIGSNTKVYWKNNNYEQHDSLINTNPFRYIEDIKSFDELVNNSKINEIELIAKKNKQLEYVFDSKENVITNIFYKENGDTSSYTIYEYDEDKNKIYSYQSGIDGTWIGETEHYFEYEQKYEYWEPLLKKQRNLLQNVRIDYDKREERKRITDITLYKYDTEDRLTEEIEYRKGVFQIKCIYEYNNQNQVIKRTSYLYNLDKVAIKETYLYNKEGYVIKETNKDFRTGKMTVNKYRYEYEYYK